jgi:hypothetical protein
MRSKYVPPARDQSEFHCALCNVFASQRWYKLQVHIGPYWHATPFAVSVCAHCEQWTYWKDQTMAIPASAPVEIRHTDLPDDCQAEYDEARAVFSESPRAAAALLRLSVQKLMPHLGEKGKNINDDIASLVSKGLPVTVQRALDFCRVIGNNAVHPGEIVLNDTPEVAQQLFTMINFIVEDRITRPREIEVLYNTLPETARLAIEKRDQKQLPPGPKES